MVTKLLFDFLILSFFILTIVFGTFKSIWYIRENEYSEPFNIVWVYGLFIYPIIGPGLILNIVLSIFFSQGIIIQIIYDRNRKDFDPSLGYYKSLFLAFLALLTCLFLYEISTIYNNAFYIYDMFIDYEDVQIRYSTRILLGFYFGLLSILVIFIKYIFLN